MSFSPLGNYLPKLAKRPLMTQAGIALALEAGTVYIVEQNPALKTRVRLVSLKKGLVHAITTSSSAKEELISLKEPLFKAMKLAAEVPLSDLRVEVRGSLAEEQYS